MKKILMIVGALIIAVAIAAGSFYGGMAYQRSQANAIRDNFLRSRGLEGIAPPSGGSDGVRGVPGDFFGGGITGQVKSVLGDTIILSTPQSEIEVSLSEATIIQKTSAGTTADLQPDQQVMVTGERDTQGHITAIRVLILSSGQPASEATP